MNKPLPCIVCGVQPRPVFPDDEGTRQPYGATMFHAGSGHYGSTVWDEMNGRVSLDINVCDPCLIERKDRCEVSTSTRTHVTYTYAPWDPDARDDD